MGEKFIAIEKLNHRLTGQDASFIYGESRNGPLHVGSLSYFDDRIEYPELLRHFESRLHLIPRYRQRVVPVPFNLGHATFEDDPDFKLEHHVRLHRLPPNNSEAQLIKAAMAIFRKPMDRKRPLWEVHLFNRFKGGRSVVMWSIHHCLIDGASGMELLNVILDARPNPVPAESNAEPWSPKPIPGALRRMIDATVDRARERLDAIRNLNVRAAAEDLQADAATIARLARQMSRPIADTPWNAGYVTQERTLAWMRTPLSDLTNIRAAFGGTVNDVVLAMLTEGAARYLRENGRKPGAPLRIGCPVNVRHDHESGALGNRVSMMFPELPAEPMDPIARLKLVTAETRRIKDAGEAQALEKLMSNGAIFSPALIAALAGVATTALDGAVSIQRAFPALARRAALPIGINFVATNVPGAKVPLYLAGHRMLDYVGLLPLGANLGFGVPIIGYNQNLYMTMMAEPKLMPDPERMKALVEQVFDELKRAAGAQALPVESKPEVKRPKQAASSSSTADSAHPGIAAAPAN